MVVNKSHRLQRVWSGCCEPSHWHRLWRDLATKVFGEGPFHGHSPRLRLVRSVYGVVWTEQVCFVAAIALELERRGEAIERLGERIR